MGDAFVDLRTQIHGMLNEVQRAMLQAAAGEIQQSESINRVVAILKTQALELEKEAVQKNNGKTRVNTERYTITMTNTRESTTARWTGSVYIDERDRCWVPIGEAKSGEVVVSLVSFQTETILGLLKLR